ncbi:heme A synthase [Chloropicon primus]|nr:heme A synthase [Chloropicon primus]
MSEASVESGLTRGMSSTSRKWVGGWLGLCSAWVFSMVVLGGITRLTRSGLSMTEWKFAGERPPLNHEDWVKEFAKYKQSPEFKKVNLGMSLEEFKFIYWMEYGHRMWGRVLGLVFGLPFAYFAATRKLSAPLTRRLGLLMLMGGGQGLVGWWMVKSGLKEPTEYQYDVPRVSPYRLAAHLTSAFVIYSGLLWTTLSVLMPKTPMQLAQELHAAGSGVISGGRRLGRHLGLYAVLVSLTAVSGAFVAGLDAGHAYNTFPLMGDPGRVFPTDYWGHEGGDWGDWAGLDPADRVSRILANTFENTCAVQFHHRVLAVTTLLASTSLFLIHRRSPLPNHSATLLKVLCGMAWCQVGLGITTLLNYVPVHLGSAHQAGALTLMSVALASIYCTRPLKAAQAASRGAQAVLGRTVA